MRSILVFLLLITAIPRIALASPPESAVLAEAEGLARQAKEAFIAKDFEVAAKLFMSAYGKSHSPALVFNAARSYEEAGKVGDAAALFRLYISLTSDTAGLQEAREHLAKLEARQVVQPDAEPVPPPGSTVARSVPRKADGAPSHVAAWMTTGGSALALATGVTLLLVGKSDAHQANVDGRQTLDSNAYSKNYSTAQSEWLAGAVLTGVGAVLGGVAVYLWARPNAVNVRPTPNGVALSGAF